MRFQTYNQFLDSLKESEIFSKYPLAVIGEEAFSAYRYRWESSVLHKRSEILTEYARKEGYNYKNISRIAILDVARLKKIRYFLEDTRVKDKMLHLVIKNIKK